MEVALYWLHRPVPAKSARKFLSSLNEILVLCRLSLAEVDSDLLSGCEVLIRPMITSSFDKDDDYVLSKVTIASKIFGNFFHTHELPMLNRFPGTSTVDELLNGMIFDFDTTYQNHKDLRQINVAMIRLILALLYYFQDIRRKRKYLDIPENLLDEFQSLISPYFENDLGFFLPGARDKDDLIALSEACMEKWAELHK